MGGYIQGMNCDNCKHYRWYYDRCDKWDVEVNPLSVHNCWEPMEKHLPNRTDG